MASDSNSDAIGSQSSLNPIPSDTVLDDESRLSSSNPSPSPMASASNSNANMSSSSPNPMPSDSTTNGENRLSSYPMTPNPNHNPTPSNPAQYDHQTNCPPPPSQIYNFQPSSNVPPMASNANHYPTPPNYQNYGQPRPSQYYELFQPSYYPSPPHYYYDPAYAPPPDDGGKKYCLCRLILIIIAVLIDLAIISFFVDLAFKPEHPNFSLSSATVSSFTTSTNFSTISYDFKLTFSIENPNKRMDIDYVGVETTVQYGIHNIATNEQHKFFQNANGTISKEVRVVEVDHDVSSHAVKAIEDDVAKNHGEVKFGVKMEAYLRFSKIHWLPRYYGAYCPDVKFQFVNGTVRGEMVGPAITCNSVEDWR